MKYFTKLVAAALILASTACTENTLESLPGEENNGSAEETVDEGRRTVEVLIQNNLQLGAARTKADTPIATNAENEITSMDIYVFGSLTENGKYTYQERLSYRAGEEVQKTDEVYPFVLVPSASDTKVSTARLSIKKGLYVKLYCVVNQENLYTLDDTPAYKEATFTPLKQTAPGTVDNEVETEGIPTESDFLSKYVVHVINPDDETDVISTPLVMSGDIAGCIDLTDVNENSRLNVSMKLSRAVARFDVSNDQSKTRLNITSIGMVGGNATTSLFPYVGQGDAQGEMIDYPVRKFIVGSADNTALNSASGLKAAYYTYAAPETAELVLNGTYTTAAGEAIPVAYKVPFQHIVDGTGSKVTINPNHRYTVKINDASAYEVKLTIEVADWEDGGSLDDYTPDNTIKIDAPGISETYTQFSGDYTWAGVNQNASNNTTLFTYTLESNSELSYELVYFGVEVEPGTGWLNITESKQSIGNGAQNSYKYLYTVKKVTPTQPSSSSYPTATIVFKNKVGTVVNLVIQPRPQLGSYYANLVGDYWVAYTSQGNSTVTLATAKSACTGEWRLPTMNEWRKIVRSDDDWNHYLTPGTDAFYEFFEGTDATTVKTVDSSVKANLFNGASNCYGLNTNNYYWSSDASKKTPENNLCLYVTNYSSGQVSYASRAAGSNNALVRCIKDKQK